APAWGTTIAAIVQACDEMNVPRPGTGHWTLVRRGWEVGRPPLPEAGHATAASVSLKSPGEGRKKGPAELGTVKEVEKPRRKVEVPKSFENAHRFVKQTRRALTTDTYLDKGMVHTRAIQLDHPLSLDVSPGQLDRALLVYDAIVKGITELGGKFVTGPERWRLRLFIGKQEVRIHIREAMKMLPLDLTDEEKEAKGYSRWDRHEWKGSGLLRFKMHGTDLNDQIWQDSKRVSLEDQVGDIIEALASAEEVANRVRAEREECRRRREEQWAREQEARRKEEERRKEIERRQREEEDNRERLVTMADNWREARLVRRFIRACEGVLAREAQAQDGWQERWLKWAKAHADRVDPMTNGYLESERQRLAGGGQRSEAAEPES
ncbi:MAG TPA: hypothetical protein VJA21_08000, partial [Verrucomicrobiae bacterium]